MSESTGVIVGRVQTTEIPAFALQAPSFGYQSTEEVHGSFTSKAPLRAFFQVVASGTEPHTCRGFKRGGKDAGLDDLVSLLPENAIVLRTSTLSERDEESLEPKLAMTDILTRISEGHVYLGLRQTMVEVRVSGTDPQRVASLVDEILVRAPGLPKIEDNTVPIRTFYVGSRGVTSIHSRIEVPLWPEVARNYPQQTASQLADLMAVERPQNQGGLLLWHGPPGTGKTTALRSMAASWKSWCDIAYVADPEKLFAESGYLIELLNSFASNRNITEPSRHFLIVAEDSDEFLRADARRSAGAALGRLLNLTDGILGQGTNALVLLTTNEDLKTLHPALIRPGRALAKVEFPPFSTEDANEWLGGSAYVDGSTTLAELYEKLGTVKRIKTPEIETLTPGMYL